jgi:NTP pyrophosphatase (non-canonical NTP hydrolase)
VYLQKAVADWHTNRFPEAEPYHVMIKAMEELGEVASALNGDLAKNDGRSREGSVPNEVGDVIICLMVLLGRWYPEHDALLEVMDKLAILTNPNSGHRSAALPKQELVSPCLDSGCKTCLPDDPRTWHHQEEKLIKRCRCGDFAGPNGTCNWGDSGCYNCPA